MATFSDGSQAHGFAVNFVVLLVGFATRARQAVSPWPGVNREIRAQAQERDW
jgi:hypothetical protein